jgi:hypothetical protein
MKQPIQKHIGKNTIESDIQELKNIKLTPERRKQLQEKLDYFNYGHNPLRQLAR